MACVLTPRFSDLALPQAVIHFVTNLCEVSMEELESENPRIFSLQKIVESASVNMNRVRIVWGQIWKVLAEHFTRVGCHANQNIAMFAIDSLRQLAYKFLEKDELSNFNFQQEFLLPFEHIVANSQNVQIRELVVCCVDQMIQARSKNLISGWKSALNVLTIAAGDPDEMIINLGFRIAGAVVREHFQEIVDVFVDLTNCMVPRWVARSLHACMLVETRARWAGGAPPSTVDPRPLCVLGQLRALAA